MRGGGGRGSGWEKDGRKRKEGTGMDIFLETKLDLLTLVCSPHSLILFLSSAAHLMLYNPLLPPHQIKSWPLIIDPYVKAITHGQREKSE